MATSTLDLEAIRAGFPALGGAGPDGRPLVHADAPAGTQVHVSVLEAMRGWLVSSNANQGGAFAASQATDALCERVRAQAAAFTGGDAGGVVFGPNMTTLTFHLSHALDDRLGPRDELACTRLDHDANVAPWLALARRTGATVRWMDVDPATGRLATDALDAITGRTRLVAFPVASNALGTLVEIEPVVRAARAAGALVFADAVHAAPHVRLDRRGWGVDVLACSAYKFFGPHAGLLSADPALLADLRPDKVRPAPDQGPGRWETGTPTFETIAGTGAAIAYVDGLGLDTIARHERALASRFLDGLAGIDAVRLHGPPEPDGRTPTFALTLDGVAPDEVARDLAAWGVNVWAGSHYALEPTRALGLLERGGTVRVGFVHYHGHDDVDRVLEALAACAARRARPRAAS